jgi:hypothetical protein
VDARFSYFLTTYVAVTEGKPNADFYHEPSASLTEP